MKIWKLKTKTIKEDRIMSTYFHNKAVEKHMNPWHNCYSEQKKSFSPIYFSCFLIEIRTRRKRRWLRWTTSYSAQRTTWSSWSRRCWWSGRKRWCERRAWRTRWTWFVRSKGIGWITRGDRNWRASRIAGLSRSTRRQRRPRWYWTTRFDGSTRTTRSSRISWTKRR